jgi:hypothetical protein
MVKLHVLLTLATLLVIGTEGNTTAESSVEAWVGHEVLTGKRKLPIYGYNETHTENFLVAEVRRDGQHIDIRQKICRTEVRPIKGVTVSMSKESVLRLPKARFVLDVGPDGSLTAPPWTTGWGSEDIDADGAPGATIHIDSTKCGGDVYATNQTVTRLVSGHATDDSITGEIAVQVKQKILGASGLCLKLMAGDSEEHQTGRFSYRRVPIGTSCRSLANEPWPVNAEAPAK